MTELMNLSPNTEAIFESALTRKFHQPSVTAWKIPSSAALCSIVLLQHVTTCLKRTQSHALHMTDFPAPHDEVGEIYGLSTIPCT